MKKIPRELSEARRIKGEAMGRLGDGESLGQCWVLWLVMVGMSNVVLGSQTRFEELTNLIRTIRNAMKIRDVTKCLEEFELSFTKLFKSPTNYPLAKQHTLNTLEGTRGAL